MFKEFIYLVKLLFHNKPKDCKDLEIIKCKKVTDCFVVNNFFKELTKKEISIKELNFN